MNEGNPIDETMPVDQEDDQALVAKYAKLLKKCEQIRMENFRLINYIDQINKLVRKVRKQNAFIVNKLDQNNDDYYKTKPSILKDIEFAINYGKSKIVKENTTNSTKIKYLNKQINEQTIDHRNKRIKLEQALEDHLMNSNLDEFIVT